MSGSSDFNSQRLSELVFALASPGAAATGYVSLCEQLWDDPFHHGWIAAALMRRASLVNDEPDQALVHLLARYCSGVLTEPQFNTPPSTEQIGECLPNLILLLPEDAWAKPFSLWPSLLVAVCEEFGLPMTALPSIETREFDPQAEALAGLFSQAIGSPWTEDLDQHLDQWCDRSEYTWLKTLRQSARLQRSLEALNHHFRFENPFQRIDLILHLQSLPPFERRRWLVLRRQEGTAQLWAEPQIDPQINSVEWLFRIPVSAGDLEHLRLMVEDQCLGEIRLHRTASNQIEIEEATGVLATLPLQTPCTLELVRAASDQVTAQEMIPLISALQGQIQPTESGAVLRLLWHPSESGDD